MKVSHMGKSHTSVKVSLQETVQKLRADIDALQARGISPNDYSLGFANAMIFCLARLEGKLARPKFYDHKTQIGKLPIPVHFQHNEAENALDAAEYDAKVQNILDGAKNAVKAWHERADKGVDEDMLPRALAILEEFIDDLGAFEREKLHHLPPGDAPGVSERIAP